MPDIIMIMQRLVAHLCFGDLPADDMMRGFIKSFAGRCRATADVLNVTALAPS